MLQTAAAEWRSHWKVVLAAGLGMGLLSVPAYSIGIFLAPLEAEFGWKRAEISSAAIFLAVASVALGPIVGLAVDRLGPRRIAIPGAIVSCAAIASMSLTNSLWSWWAIWAFTALGTVLVQAMVWTAAVSSLFNASRGLALSVTLCGTALASSLTPVMASLLIQHFGWRGAYLGISAFFLVLVTPALLLFFSSARDALRLSRATGSDEEKPTSSGLTARQALGSFRFIRLCIAAATMVLTVSSCVLNLIPILASMGHPQLVAAQIAGMAGLSTIAGRLLGGILLDRTNANWVAAASAALPILAILLLVLFPPSLATASAAALVFGLALGAEYDSVAYLTTRHFGLRSFGVLFGIASAIITAGAGVGPIILSHIYDVVGSYRPALVALIPISVLGVILFLSLGKYPSFDHAEAA